jgi:hypothetical protein
VQTLTKKQVAALDAVAVAFREITKTHRATCVSLSFHSDASGGFYSATVHDRFKAFAADRVRGYTLASLVEGAIHLHNADHPTEIERARKRAKEAADDAERAAAVLRELEAVAA